MKRILILWALMLVGSLAMWAQTPADGIYKIICPNAEGANYSQRGAIAYKTGNEQYVYLAEVGGLGSNTTNATAASIDTDGVCGYWGIKTHGGKTWFYNLGNAKTISKPTNDDQATTWADIAADNNVTFETSTDAGFSGQFRIKGNYSGAYLSVSAWWGTRDTGGARWYNKTSDNGCNLNIVAVETAKAEALAAKYADNIAAAELRMGIEPVVANGPLTALSELSNRKAYTIVSYRRGAWTAKDGSDKIWQTSGLDNSGNAFTSGSGKTTSADDPDQQWAILKSENNNYYLYNIGQKKFFVSQSGYTNNSTKATLAAEPNSDGFSLKDRLSAITGSWKTSNPEVRWALAMNVNGTDYHFGVTNWTGQSWQVFQDNTDYNKNNDEGMYFKVEAVGDFNPAEAMAKIVEFETVPLEYILASAGTPEGATVTINGTSYTNINDQGLRFECSTELSLSDIHVSCSDGYVYYVQLDNANHQINVAFKQLFIPAESTDDLDNTYFIYDTANRYVTINSSNNIFYTKGRSGADRFIFLNDAKNPGKYFIYDVTAKKYLYWTAASATQNVQSTSGSKIQFTTDANTANSWGILGEDYDITGVDIFASSVDLATVVNSTQGWNFRGGDGYVLNFYNRDDQRSSWKIADATVGSLACATLVFSEPGKEFIHKLVPENGVSVVSVDFGEIQSLTLKTDRARYKYVSGTAPTAEGTYTYTVNLSDGSKAKVTLKVDNFLQSPTPFMGWLSWNWFQRGINATNMTAIAQGMNDKGLVAAGFNTLVLDDTWANQTRDKAALDWNSTKFPNPTQFVAGVKALGLKVGLYSDAGSMTCEDYQPGSYGYEAQHMAKFDSWGVDFLKYDRCAAQGGVIEAYTAMGREIAKVNEKRKANGGVPFMYNACEWGDNQPWTWGAEAGASSWRSSHDVREDWCGNNSRPGVLYSSDVTRNYWMYAGVNRYNDLDMMCIGLHGLGGPSNNTAGHLSNGGKITGLTTEQARSQMSIWCMFASPLSLTCDVRKTPSADGNSTAGTLPNPLITADDIAILTNKDIIAINQDALGQQAEYMPDLSYNDAIGTTNTGGYSVYLKDLTGGRKALAVVNRSGSATLSAKTFNLADLYLDEEAEYLVKDVWSGAESTCKGTLSTTAFAASETKVYVLTPVSIGALTALIERAKAGQATMDEVNALVAKILVLDAQGNRVKSLEKGNVYTVGGNTIEM